MRPPASDPSTPSRWLQPRYWFFGFFVAYAATVPWPNYHVFSASVRLAIFNLRPPLIAAVLGVTLLGLFLTRNRALARFVASGTTARVFAASLLYPAWYLLAGLIKARLAIPSLGLYLLWSLTCFLIVPVLVRRTADLRWLAGALAILLTADIAHALAFGPALPQFSMEGRLSYGYANPNYFAQLTEAAVVAIVYWSILRPPRPDESARRTWMIRALCVGAWVASMGLAQQAVSRNVMVFLVTLAAVWLLLRGGRRLLPFVHLLIVGIAIVTAVVFATTDRDTLNELSSKRYELWTHHVEHMLDSDDPLSTWAFGPATAADADFVPSYDDVGADKAYTKLHVDNFFLEQLLEGGLPGLVLFMVPYLMLLRIGARRLGTDHDPRMIAWAMAVLVAALVQGMFIATMPTFNAPLGITLVILSVAPFYVPAPQASRPGLLLDGAGVTAGERGL